MHDIKYIRENPEEFDARLKRRGHEPMSNAILALDKGRREIITHSQKELSEKNAVTKKAGEAKASGNQQEFEKLRNLVAKLKKDITFFENTVKRLDEELQNMLHEIPNFAMDDVPTGKDENDNVEVSKWSEPRKFNFEAQEHFDIPAVRPSMDFILAAELSGSRFVLMSGSTARVHRALAQFMLDIHTQEHGLLEVNTPVIVNTLAMYGTGQLPKFADDCYKTDNGQWLIPTSEVSLTNIVADKILTARDLPYRYCAHSLCFRKEAGSAGRDTSGMLRMHQFEKVEMVSIAHPDESRKELDRMTECAEAVLKKLEIPYRIVVLCTGDMGFSAQRTHDIEVWLPGQNRYREISSVSVCGDFQARRMNARFREKDGDKPQFVHTLNGSGVAVGRCLIAVLENGQQKDGSVKLPKALHPYLGGKDTINPDGILEKAT